MPDESSGFLEVFIPHLFILQLKKSGQVPLRLRIYFERSFSEVLTTRMLNKAANFKKSSSLKHAFKQASRLLDWP